MPSSKDSECYIQSVSNPLGGISTSVPCKLCRILEAVICKPLDAVTLCGKPAHTIHVDYRWFCSLSRTFGSTDSLVRIRVVCQSAPGKWFLLDGNFPQGGQSSKRSLVSVAFTASHKITDFKAERDLSHLIPLRDFMMRKLRHRKVK